MKLIPATLVILTSSLQLVFAFLPPPTTHEAKWNRRQSLHSTNNDSNQNDVNRKIGASVVAASFFLSNAFSIGAAFAVSPETYVLEPINPTFASESSLVLAARSGGRAGGRAPSMPPSRSYSRTTIITAPSTPVISAPIVVSPFGASVGYGYSYNPLGGFGLGYGLGAMNSIGDSVRDYRQESEIQRERAELEVAKGKQAELEARIKELEKSAGSIQK